MNTTKHAPTPLKAGPVFNKDGRAIFWTDTSKPGKWQRRLDEAGIFSESDAAHIVLCVNSHDALMAVAKAALNIYSEMGTRLSAAAFDDLSQEAKTALHDSLSNLKAIQSLNQSTKE